MELPPLTIRILDPGEVDEFVRMVLESFLEDPHAEEIEDFRELAEPERFHALLDGGRLVGGGGVLTRDMTLPGVGPVPVAAVTAVGVAADQRRRGGLRTLMRTQLHGLHEAGAEPVAALWASEGGIYGRFGYGASARRARLAVPRGAQFREGVGPARVRMLDADAALPAMQELYERVWPHRVGWISRTAVTWREWFLDAEHHRRGASAYRYLVNDDGYAAFRVKPDGDDRGPRYEVRVHELVAATPAAHATLWRFLLDLDFGAEVVHRNVAVDEPLPLLLADPRAAVVTVSDSLWIRLVDLDRALVARRYAAPCALVLEVTDALCSWNGGRWRLDVSADGTARVERTDADPDLSLDIADLGAAYLGDTRFTALAAAGRVSELRPGAVVAATRAFAGDTAPHCPEVF